MKTISKKKRDILIQKVTATFPSFGGGQTSNFNPIVNALKDKPPVFAANVDISQVVDFILRNI